MCQMIKACRTVAMILTSITAHLKGKHLKENNAFVFMEKMHKTRLSVTYRQSDLEMRFSFCGV